MVSTSPRVPGLRPANASEDKVLSNCRKLASLICGARATAIGGGVAEVAMATGALITRAAAGADESSPDWQAQSANAIGMRDRSFPGIVITGRRTSGGFPCGKDILGPSRGRWRVCCGCG